MKIRAIITGVTGMVGEGVLHECLQSDQVEQVLILGRRPYGLVHPKVKEIVHADLYDLSPIEDQLRGYNACYFCLGTSSVGMNEEDFSKITYTLTLHVATILSRQNSDMTFCYVSGGGTDSTEKGRVMWARVKGRTENDLMKLPFKQVFNFRPGYMHPTPGLKNTLSYYKYLSWLYPVFKLLFPGFVTTLRDLGVAMIQVTLYGYSRQHIEVRDIKILSKMN
ncbi:MAG: NAD-dependent epimerase/dehydratase family protein [Saprospiraceae bacterium]|nr:NAD-dependent epimerase/dehydratase family protein [Saprospiraceae bacterium]